MRGYGIEAYETKDIVILRNPNVNSKGKDRIQLLTKTGESLSQTEGMMVFVSPDVARKASLLMQTTKQIPGQNPWEFRILQDHMNGPRPIRSLEDIDTVGTLGLYLVRKDVTGKKYAHTHLVGTARRIASEGSNAVIIRRTNEYTHNGHFEEIFITGALTDTQSKAVERFREVASPPAIQEKKKRVY